MAILLTHVSKDLRNDLSERVIQRISKIGRIAQFKVSAGVSVFRIIIVGRYILRYRTHCMCWPRFDPGPSCTRIHIIVFFEDNVWNLPACNFHTVQNMPNNGEPKAVFWAAPIHVRSRCPQNTHFLKVSESGLILWRHYRKYSVKTKQIGSLITSKKLKYRAVDIISRVCQRWYYLSRSILGNNNTVHYEKIKILKALPKVRNDVEDID